MRSKLYIICLILLAVTIGQTASGQSDGVSPYSSIGLGDFYDSNFFPVVFGGGLAATYHDPNKANVANPASLGYLASTSFEFGASGQFNTLSQSDRRVRVRSGNLSYLSLSLPLVNPINELLENRKRKFRWGAQIALLPYTNVSYDLQGASFIQGLGTVRRSIVGDGNTYKLLMNHGLKRGHTSFGASMGLLLGGISFSEGINFPDQPNSQASIVNNEYSVSGFIWNIGAQHDFLFDKGTDDEQEDQRISSTPKLTLGLTFHSNTSFNTTTDLLTFASLDTISQELDIKGKGKLPMEINVGANYYAGYKWSAGANLYLGRWSNYSNDATEATTGSMTELLRDAYRLSVGGSYTPNRNSIRNLFARSTYKFGIFYGTDPRVFNNEQINQYGANVAVELPFLRPRNFSFVNLGVEYGRSDVDALKNTYVKINLGLTFNSNQWFIKRKYN